MAARIRAQMALQGISQRDLAELLGQHEVWVSRRVSPRVSKPVFITVGQLRDFSEALHVPITNLLPDLEPILDEPLPRSDLTLS